MRRHRLPPGPPLAGFAALSHGGTSLLVRRGYEDAAPFFADFDRLPSAETIAGGREAHPVLALPGGERVVVRRYRRGGMVRHVNRALYFGGNRAFDELRATERARMGGVRAPVVVAAAERAALVGYRAALATLLIPHAKDGAAWLASASAEERLRMLREAGRQIALMHAAGVAHPDLNLRNLLVVAGSESEGSDRSDSSDGSDVGPGSDASDGEGRSGGSGSDASGMGGRSGGSGPDDSDDPDRRPGGSENGDDPRPIVYLLDFDRAEVTPDPVAPPRRMRDLRRLARSARKLAAPVDALGWEALREGYGEGWPRSLDAAALAAGAG
jgi:Lipopolysaccharide kinase (Kdo/WaaP) family